jgi:hypothetical protein
MRFSTQETQQLMNVARKGSMDDLALIIKFYAQQPLRLGRALDWLQVGIDSFELTLDPGVIARKQALIDEARVIMAEEPAGESLRRIGAGGLAAVFRAAVGLHGHDPLVLAQLQAGLMRRDEDDPDRAECQKTLEAAARQLYLRPH